MSKPRWLKQVEEKAVVKPVLLVEGNTDLRILSYFLEQVSPGWAAQIVMLPAKRSMCDLCHFWGLLGFTP